MWLSMNARLSPNQSAVINFAWVKLVPTSRRFMVTRRSLGYTIVREYVAAAMLRTREMFVPLSHRPGNGQADFGEADGYIGGKKVRFHYFCMDLPHSDGCFVKAYPAETAEAFCDGHVSAFDFFGGV